MSSRVTSGATSKSSQSNSQRRQRSRSTSRYADLEKPKKKKTLSATTSLVSIPNTIKLSMLNSGLLSFEKVKLEARDQNNSMSQTIPDTPIVLQHFVKLCEQRRKFPVLYKLEFQTAVRVETNSCRHASRKNNEEKNQNQKCIPYDYNRVVLEKMRGTPDSDYINASYIDSLLKPNAYIVTQGPTEETVNDFWRMIWQEKVSAIIMLTKTFDFTKVMCMQYWPPALEKQEIYGDIYIQIAKEEQLANFHIRTFRIWKQNPDKTVAEERQIIQFHYTEWHSHTCPFSNAVLEFRRRVRAVVGHIITANSMVGPMLVHCNDGGGRSGVYMSIDANLELAEEEDSFHVFGYLKKIRQSRKGLIENVDQYKFVYDTLEEHIICGKTWFSVSELSERLKEKAQKDPVTKMNHYQMEYAQICKQTPRFTIGDCAGGHRADNRDKNRDVLCVPPDNFRPYLTSFQGNAFTDYINAVFVDGYTKPREYIVTEWPLKHTVGEFWSLVYDQECSAVVVLLQPPPNSTTYPSFWPEKSKMEKYGPVFSVHSVSRKHYTNIKQWEFKINKKIVSLTELMAGVKAPTKTVQLFQLTCFPLGHKVPTSTNSLVALMNMVENWRAKTDYGPVCVVSPDGRSRAGVYCAANACIEQVIQHGEVDIFQAVKTVRRQRPQLVENMMEYKYCYDLVLHYVLHYLNKDLKEKKFIEFGRGKVIPLTPDSSTDLPNEMSNIGKIVVKKRITKIEKGDCILKQQQLQQQQMNNGQILQRKKKGRLYSLGGNEPTKKPGRGRLDRLKTVGTFDLGTEMSVLSEVARNLNEQIISGELIDRNNKIINDGGICSKFLTSNRRLSTIPAATTGSSSLTEQSTPSSGRREFQKQQPKRSNRNSENTSKTDLNLIPKQKPLRKNSPAPSSAINNNNNNNNTTGILVRAQRSADDCLEKRKKSSNNLKSRSLSTSSYMTSNLNNTNNRINDINLKTVQINLINNTSSIAGSNNNQQQIEAAVKNRIQQLLPQEGVSENNSDEIVMVDNNNYSDDKYNNSNSTNIVNISIKDSNKIDKSSTRDSGDIGGDGGGEEDITTCTSSSQIDSTINNITTSQDKNLIDKDSNKIELDMQSAEDIYKCDDIASSVQNYVDDDQIDDDPPLVRRVSRKPVLRKSKRIVRTDSEIFDENIIATSNEIILQANSDIQIHNEPTIEDCGHIAYDDTVMIDQQSNKDVPTTGGECKLRNRSSATSTTTNASRKESSDIDDICSPREYPMNKSTDDSSRNMSTDELDTVFSDITDLEQIEREYRELLRSNLQREYKSDGDSLDEVGKKRNDFMKWKNQSFENNFELYPETTCNNSNNSGGNHETVTSSINNKSQSSLDHHHHNINQTQSEICSPESQIISTTTISSDTSSSNKQHQTESNVISSCINYPFPIKPILKTNSSRESIGNGGVAGNSNVTSPTIPLAGGGNQINKFISTNTRPSKLEIFQNVPTTSAAPLALSSSSKEGTITSLFEKRFGKIKKINKLLKCKRFSTSALYDKKSKINQDDNIIKNDNRIVLSPSQTRQTKSMTTPPPSATQKEPPTTNKIFRTKFSPNKSSNILASSKNSIYSSKMSLFKSATNKNSIFSIRKSPMFTNASHSNTELNLGSSGGGGGGSTGDNTDGSIRTKMCETSKSNSELNKNTKTSPTSSRFGSTKRSMKGNSSKNNSTVCLSFNQQQQQPKLQSPLSEEFYNKTGSVRLSAMELYEKFCSEDFGGLYKHETNGKMSSTGGACGGYRNWHEYRLGQKGLGVSKKYTGVKNAKLLRQKSEPKFSFRDDSSGGGPSFFPEEEDEDIYEEEGDDDGCYYDDQEDYDDEDDGEDEYGDEYEDEECDYYEDEEVEDEEEEGEDEENEDVEKIGKEECSPVNNIIDNDIKSPLVIRRVIAADVHSANVIDDDSGGGVDQFKIEDAYHSEIDDRGEFESHGTSIANDSDVDEIFLMPSSSVGGGGGGSGAGNGSGSKCTDDYEEFGFENKKFSLEQSLLHRASSTDSGLDHHISMVGVGQNRQLHHHHHHHHNNYQQQFNKDFNSPNQHPFSMSQEIREIDDDFGSDEILTIYCSKENILEAKNIVTWNNLSKKLTPPSTNQLPSPCTDAAKIIPISSTIIPEDDSIDMSKSSSNSLEYAVNEYIKNAPPDVVSIEIEPPIYKTDCTSTNLIIRSDSMELLSSSSGTLRSGSTLTEYAFDTVRNLNLDSCSTSKLSLSLKSEIFDDFTLTPDEPRIVRNCEFEDFTLTPDGSVSETPAIAIASSSDQSSTIINNNNNNNNNIPVSKSEEDFMKSEESSIETDDVIVLVDKFLTNERLVASTISTNIINTKDSIELTGQLNEKSFERTDTFSSEIGADELFSIIDIDEEEQNNRHDNDNDDDDDDNNAMQNVVSAFTNEITKEFDLLFSRAKLDNEVALVKNEKEQELLRYQQEPYDNVELNNDKKDKTDFSHLPLNDHHQIVVDTDELIQSPTSEHRYNNYHRLPSRYSMQRLEPYFIAENNGENGIKLQSICTTTPTGTHNMNAQLKTEYCKVLDVHDGCSSTFIHRRVITKLKKNRSQSLGNLNNKTRCFPL